MPRYRVLPYRQGSRGARALADALPRGRVLKIDGTGRFRPRPDDIVINWGKTGDLPFPIRQVLNLPVCDFRNEPEDIINASNKLRFFQTMMDGCEDIIPDWWSRREEIPDEAFPVVCRTVLAGHSGEGIVIANNRDELVNAPLYVKYIKKQDEYRIHVGIRNEQTSIIAVQRKARREGHENPNWQVRNHQNGFVYVRGGVNPPISVLEAAMRALEATGLDFGAVDVIYNQRQERAYVLEINTAPGLEGQTVMDYAAFFTGQ